MHMLHVTHHAACGASVQDKLLYTEVRVARDEDIAANQNFRTEIYVSVHNQRSSLCSVEFKLV
jgi:hypothetical protein